VVGTDRERKTGALRALLARNDGDCLIYAGAAFIALAGDERAKFFAEIERLNTCWAAFCLALCALARNPARVRPQAGFLSALGGLVPVGHLDHYRHQFQPAIGLGS